MKYFIKTSNIYIYIYKYIYLKITFPDLQNFLRFKKIEVRIFFKF
jgi:hypothetical protein